MAYNHSNGFVVNEDQISSFLEEAVRCVENASASDVEALDAIKKLFKKVPMFRRKYVTAWLIKQAILSGKAGRLNFKDRNRFDRGQRPDFIRDRKDTHEENTERAPRIKIDPSAASTIFISVGKNRHVFKRDLVGLLANIAKIDHDRIGEIRLFPHFSFVQLFKEDSDKAISALNGYDFRGRKLTVNYSKPKDFENSTEESSEEYSSEDTTVDSVSTVSQDSVSVEAEDTIPSNVTNVSNSTVQETSESEKIASEQAVFAQNQAPYSETTDDGQVKSHFGDGAAY